MGKKSCIKTGRYPKGEKLTKGQMAGLISEPGMKEIYRQSTSLNPRVWHTPKALTEKGTWRPIKNGQYVIGTWYNKDGGHVCKNRKGKDRNKFALWRMWDIKRNVKREDGQLKWEPRIYVVYYSKKYTIYYLVCRRRRYSLSGAGIG